MNNWKPAYTIKSYPELRGFFGRGENHLLSYLHNWTYHLTRSGKSQSPEWVFLTQQQIAEAIDYSVSSVKRFVRQVNQKIGGAIEVRSRQISVTKFFSYTAWEYRVNWQKVTSFLTAQNGSANLLENAVMAESSHLHFELGGVQNELGVAQNELTYNNQIKDQVNKLRTSPTPPKIPDEGRVPIEIDLNPWTVETDIQTAVTHNPCHIDHKSDISMGRSSAAPQKMDILPRHAAALGLIARTHSDGTKSYVPNPAGRPSGRSTWIEQGIAFELWADREEAINFQGKVAQYARNQSWCKSALDYSNSIIRGLIAGDNPKAERYWEAWRNDQPIGWENLFDWEVQPGVINPAFANWVSTQLFDSTKSPAANTAEAAKQIKFSAKPLWERYQREVAREVQVAESAINRGQTYLPPGALLPRTDQPTVIATEQNINWLQSQQQAALTPDLAPSPRLVAVDLAPELTAQEFSQIDQARAGIIAKMQSIADAKSFTKGTNQIRRIEPLPVVNSESAIPVSRPLIIELLPEISHQRKMLELQWRRRTPPCDLSKLAKYLIWSQKGNLEMQTEARDWLSINYATHA